MCWGLCDSCQACGYWQPGDLGGAMNLSEAEMRQLAAVASAAATESGRMIARSRPQLVHQKAGGGSVASQLVTEVDLRSEEIIVGALGPTIDRFGFGLLTEEREDDRRRLVSDYFWCIDPLDGTLAFVEDSPGYAVSIALVRRDGVPCIGVVYDPVAELLVHAIAGGGLFRNGQRWQMPSTASSQTAPGTGSRTDSEKLSLFMDRSFVAMDGYETWMDDLNLVADAMGLTGVEIDTTSGAVMNACRVLANHPACYLKLPAPTGGGNLWDFAATACIFQEAGAVATDISGGRLELNRDDSTFMNHRGVLFASDEALAKEIRALAA